MGGDTDSDQSLDWVRSRLVPKTSWKRCILPVGFEGKARGGMAGMLREGGGSQGGRVLFLRRTSRECVCACAGGGGGEPNVMGRDMPENE